MVNPIGSTIHLASGFAHEVEHRFVDISLRSRHQHMKVVRHHHVNMELNFKFFADPFPHIYEQPPHFLSRKVKPILIIGARVDVVRENPGSNEFWFRHRGEL